MESIVRSIDCRFGLVLAHVRNLGDDITSGRIDDIEGLVAAGADPNSIYVSLVQKKIRGTSG